MKQCVGRESERRRGGGRVQGKCKENSEVKNALMNITHSCEGWEGMSGVAEKMEMCINGAHSWPGSKPSTLPQPAKGRDSLLSSPGITL